MSRRPNVRLASLKVSLLALFVLAVGACASAPRASKANSTNPKSACAYSNCANTEPVAEPAGYACEDPPCGGVVDPEIETPPSATACMTNNCVGAPKPCSGANCVETTGQAAGVGAVAQPPKPCDGNCIDDATQEDVGNAKCTPGINCGVNDEVPAPCDTPDCH